MSKGTRIITGVGALALTLLFAFPPWIYVFRKAGVSSIVELVVPGPHRFIVSPPEPQNPITGNYISRFDLPRLLVEALFIIFITVTVAVLGEFICVAARQVAKKNADINYPLIRRRLEFAAKVVLGIVALCLLVATLIFALK